MLEDFINRHKSLEWIPFYLNAYRIFHDGDTHHAELKRLFEYYGWPEEFDGPAFDVSADRWRTFNRVRGLVEESKRTAFQVSEVKHLSKITGRRLQEHLARCKDGVWDDNPDLPAEEVEKLEEELEKRRNAYKIESEELAAAEEATEHMDGEDDEIEWAWKKQIETYIRWIKSNLDFSKREGRNFEIEVHTKKMEEDIRGLQEKIKNVASLPKTSEEAIQRPGPTAIAHDRLKYVI
jgi:hypothetical protein